MSSATDEGPEPVWGLFSAAEEGPAPVWVLFSGAEKEGAAPVCGLFSSLFTSLLALILTLFFFGERALRGRGL